MPVKKNRAEALSFDHSCPRNCLRETLNLIFESVSDLMSDRTDRTRLTRRKSVIA